jgi:hypothetical protein
MIIVLLPLFAGTLPAADELPFPRAIPSPRFAVPAGPPEAVNFRSFPWGTAMTEFTAKMGKPAHRDEIDGLQSLMYENIDFSGYTTYMVVYFSRNGLEGGTYYFLTHDQDELMKCYSEIQIELLGRYGPTSLCDAIIRELRPYETSWRLESGYVYLKVNTRQGEPVTLWYSSPALTSKLLGS